MSRPLLLSLLGAGCLFGAAAASALDGSAALGTTAQGELTYRLGVSRDWQQRWLASDRGHLGGYWDAAYTHWQAGEHSAAHSLSFSPVFVYEFAGAGARPFIEAGVGVALFSGTDVGHRNMSSAFHFEDRLGAGLRLEDGTRLGVRAIHYSNAGLKMPNEGIESYALFVSRPL